MEINELKEKKRTMEIAIRDAAAKAISEFREQTGYSPSHIHIQIFKAARIGDEQVEHVVTDVETTIEL